MLCLIEIKSGFQTLRRIPHLTVTWAHQPSFRSPAFRQDYRCTPAPPLYSPHGQRLIQPPFMPPAECTPRIRSHIDTFLPHNQTDHQFPQEQYGHYPPVNQRASPQRSQFDASCNAKEDVSTASQEPSFQRQRNQGVSLDIRSSKQENLSDATQSSVLRYV